MCPKLFWFADSSIPRTAILLINTGASTADWYPVFLNSPGCVSAPGNVMLVKTATAAGTTITPGPFAGQSIPADSVQLALIDCAP